MVLYQCLVQLLFAARLGGVACDRAQKCWQCCADGLFGLLVVSADGVADRRDGIFVEVLADKVEE